MAHRQLPWSGLPTEELMIATQELLRPEEVYYWVDPARGRTEEGRRSHAGR